MQKESKLTKRVAIHEAGHAVVASKLGLPVLKMERSCRYFEVVRGSFFGKTGHIFRHSQYVSAAGACAEAVVFKQRNRLMTLFQLANFRMKCNFE